MGKLVDNGGPEKLIAEGRELIGRIYEVGLAPSAALLTIGNKGGRL